MVLPRTTYKTLLAILLFSLPYAAAAAESAPLAPLSMEGKYTVAWNGVTIGRIRITAEEDAAHYHMSVDTKTSGVAALFSKERRVAEASGNVSASGYIPQRFESRPQKNDEGEITTLTYDSAGKLAKRVREPDDDPNWRPPVPAAQASTGADPITGAFTLRRQLHEALSRAAGGGKQTIRTRTYDGARLATMQLSFSPTPVTLDIMDHDTPAIEARVTRTPIAGYTPKELKKFAAGDPPISFYFSTDEKRLPLGARIHARFGDITATLVEVE